MLSLIENSRLFLHQTAKCQKALNLLLIVARTDWAADRKVLLNLYRTIIRSKLDYGSIIYGSARKSYLEMLDPIHHQGLRLALGAFRTSPSDSLLGEANEPSLYNRRLKLSMQYALKLKSKPSNPTYETVFEPQYKTLFENKPNMIPSFGIRISSEFENMNLDLDNSADFKKIVVRYKKMLVGWLFWVYLVGWLFWV